MVQESWGGGGRKGTTHSGIIDFQATRGRVWYTTPQKKKGQGSKCVACSEQATIIWKYSAKTHPFLPCHHLSPFPTARRVSSSFQSVCQRCSTDQHIGMQPSAAQLPSWPSTWRLSMSSQLCLPAPPGYAPWVQACTCKSEKLCSANLLAMGAIQVTRHFFFMYGILHKQNCSLLHTVKLK